MWILRKKKALRKERSGVLNMKSALRTLTLTHQNIAVEIDTAKLIMTKLKEKSLELFLKISRCTTEYTAKNYQNQKIHK